MDCSLPNSIGPCTSLLHHTLPWTIDQSEQHQNKYIKHKVKWKKNLFNLFMCNQFNHACYVLLISYLLPTKFFLSFLCRCINLCGISRPSWTQFNRNFLKISYKWKKVKLQTWLISLVFVCARSEFYKCIRKIYNYLARSFLKCSNHFKHRCTPTSSQVISSTTWGPICHISIQKLKIINLQLLEHSDTIAHDHVAVLVNA